MDAHSKKTVHEHASSLPFVGKHEDDERILDGAECHILWGSLNKNLPVLRDHVDVQVDFVLEEVLERINTTPDNKRLVMTHNELRGALVRMAIHSTAQSLYDVGGVLHQANQLDQLYLDPIEGSENS